MKIPKEIKAMPWPEEYSNDNPLIAYQAIVQTPVIQHQRMLVVSFTRNRNYKSYHATDKRDFKVICTKKPVQTACIIRGEKRAKNCCPSSLCGSLRSLYVDISTHDEAMLARWLGKKETMNHYLEHLNEWTVQALETERERNIVKAGGFLDEDYQLCPEELPEGLEQYIRRTVLANDNTLIYKRGNVQGRCFCCGMQVHARGERFKKGYSVKCPNCREEVFCYLENGESFRSDYVENIIFAQKGIDGKSVFFRQFHLKRDPSAAYNEIAPWLEEFGRYAIGGNEVAKWLHEYKEGYYMTRYRCYLKQWVRFSDTKVYDGSYYFYLGSVKDAVAGSSLQFANFKDYINTASPAGYGTNTVRFAMDFARYPVMEFLQKAGYTHLLNERICGQTKESRNAILWKSKSLKECFRFPLRLLKIKKPEDWCLKDILRANKLWGYHQRGAVKESEIEALLSLSIDFEYLEEAMQYASLQKILNYLKTQEQAANTYRDYIRECQQLELNLTDKAVLFPHDLGAAHQRSMAQVSFQKNKADQEKFQKAVDKLEKYAWEKDELLVRKARAQQELTQEGASLHHCVGGYIKDMAEENTAIFFIRQKSAPDTPYYTLELKKKQVTQCRTVNNRGYELDKDVKPFVDAWLNTVVNKTSKSKKQQSKKSSAA